MKKKSREFRVRLVDEDGNPFVPNINAFGRQFTTYKIKAPNKKQIREWFKEAKKRNRASVRGKRIVSIEEMKE